MNPENNTYQKGTIGSNDFKNLVKSGQYVDKSLFIKDVINDELQVPLITRPRRWGKSSNISMLKTFLEIEIDEHGNELPEAQKVNPTYFKGGEICVGNKKTLYKELRVVKCKDLLKERENDPMEYLGKHPVILMSFKDLGGESYEEIVAALRVKISAIFEKYSYLLTSNKLASWDKENINKHIFKATSLAELTDSINFLMRCLYKHFGKNVWVLIDEYDNAIHRAYTKFGKDKTHPSQFSDEFDKLLDLFRDLMSAAFKDNNYLERGVITGILRIAQANLFSGLSNVKEYGVLNKRFASYYGFEQNEVDALCKQYQIPIHKQKQLKEWYNGYTYGGFRLYNPWSIMNCMTDEDNDLKNYWEATSYGALQNLTITQESQQELQDLLSNKINSIQVYIRNGLHLKVLSDGETNGMKVLLLLAGYLNPIYQDSEEYKRSYAVTIPNQEVRIALGDLIQKWIANRLGVGEDKLQSIADLLVDGHIEQFKTILYKFLQSTLSFKIMHEKEEAIELKESHYHFLMIGLLDGIMGHYAVTHEIESGKGYVDTMIIPIALFCKNTQAIILEYKYAQEEKALQKEAKKGLAQIKKKKYIAIIEKEKHVRSVLQLGIAFHNKEVAIVHEIKHINTSS